MIICGIDYGSKLAGTTVIAWLDTASRGVQLSGSRRKEDADRFIYEVLVKLRPGAVFIDAPLSLPGVYGKLDGYTDYFFREADKQLQAMSPMFLGGLTARAIKLKKELEAIAVPVYETYPAAQAVRTGLAETGYKKAAVAISDVRQLLKQRLAPFILEPAVVTTWHQVDALLALLGGIRFINRQHQEFGNAAEGIIIV
jgi:uncharacterized protein